MALRSYSEEYQNAYNWQKVGILTAAATVSATDKSKATMEALESVVDEVEDGTVSVNYRFLCDSNADSNVIDVYAMRGNDHYARIATLTLTGGQAADGTIGVFCDTIAVTNEKWLTSIGVASPANDDYASIALNTHGYTSFLFLATTFADAQVQIEKARQ